MVGVAALCVESRFSKLSLNSHASCLLLVAQSVEYVGMIFDQASGLIDVRTVVAIVWQSGTSDAWHVAHGIDRDALGATRMCGRPFETVPTSDGAKLEGGWFVYGLPSSILVSHPGNYCYFVTNPLMLTQLSMGCNWAMDQLRRGQGEGYSRSR